VNPVWLRIPAAPLTAATMEHREIDRNALPDVFVRLKERFDFVAVEGVGGWKVPITRVISRAISRRNCACRYDHGNRQASVEFVIV
jgi:dethiobiotin synthetase